MGGAHKVYLETGNLLERYGHEVFYFSQKSEKNIYNKYSNYWPDEIEYRNVPLNKKIINSKYFLYNKSAYEKLLEFIDQVKPDLAHIHLFMGGLTVSILKALKEKNIPIVHTVHDYRLICPAYLLMDGKRKVCEKCKNGHYLHCTINRCSENNLTQSSILSIDAYYRKYFMNPMKYIDRYIFVSQFSLNKHKEFSPLFKNKTDVLYNFMPDIDAIKPSINRGNFFLFLGRLSREKGIQNLIKAAISANAKLKIVGTGPLMDIVLNYRSDNIEYLGYKEGKDLWNFVQNASFIIVPSECYENNPLTVIEAYANGKPVIASEIGGIPEIIIEGQTGYLFKMGDVNELSKTIIKASQITQAQYEVMSINARNFAKRYFNEETHYNSLIEIYREAILSKKKSYA
jgi:glycosyltransferase involved in cell wall biosynthesis